MESQTKSQQDFDKLMWRCKEPRQFGKEKRMGRFPLPDIKSSYEAIVTMTEWYDTRKGSYRSVAEKREHRNRPCLYGHLGNEKSGIANQWGKSWLTKQWCPQKN